MQLVLMASTNEVIYPSDDIEQRAQNLSETELTIPHNLMSVFFCDTLWLLKRFSTSDENLINCCRQVCWSVLPKHNFYKMTFLNPDCKKDNIQHFCLPYRFWMLLMWVLKCLNYEAMTSFYGFKNKIKRSSDTILRMAFLLSAASICFKSFLRLTRLFWHHQGICYLL